MPKDSTLTSAELIRQSEELRSQAQEMMRRERPEVIARVKEAIALYELTASELGLSGGTGKEVRQSAPTAPAASKKAANGAGRKPTKARRTAAASYRDGQGNTWSGFGPKPRWLKEALARGVSEQSLRA
jgi:DNA-binding protein H-NS